METNIKKIEQITLRIKEIRASTNLSQGKFADLIGMPLRTFQNWENASRTPSNYMVDWLEVYVNNKLNENEKGN